MTRFFRRDCTEVSSQDITSKMQQVSSQVNRCLAALTSLLQLAGWAILLPTASMLQEGSLAQSASQFTAKPCVIAACCPSNCLCPGKPSSMQVSYILQAGSSLQNLLDQACVTFLARFAKTSNSLCHGPANGYFLS